MTAQAPVTSVLILGANWPLARNTTRVYGEVPGVRKAFVDGAIERARDRLRIDVGVVRQERAFPNSRR